MAISVQCSCGKRAAVSDALAGKAMRCPACGSTVVVPGPGKAGAKGGAPARGKQAGPAIELSGGQKALIWVVGILLVLGGGFYFGPVRVWQNWNAMEPKASDDVRDLVIDSLKQHTKDEDPDPRGRPPRMPSVERGDVSFFTPMALTMPAKVGFLGKSSQGTFSGNYDTRNGEVDATVSYGGFSVAGMVDVRKPTGTFHLVGRVENGKREFEIDGKKSEINGTAQ